MATKTLLCIKCGSEGTSTWDGRHPIDTSDGFYLKVQIPLDGRLHIVCNKCGAIHPYPAC